jgi:hypothetical protein
MGSLAHGVSLLRQVANQDAICSASGIHGMVNMLIRFCRPLWAAVFASLFVHAPAICADMVIDKSLGGDEFVNISLSGEIKRGDDLLFDRLVRGGRKIWLNLDSTGGDVDAAMGIGSIIRRSEGLVFAGNCFSACVLIFAGGVVRGGASVFDDPNIGVHRIYFATLSSGLTAGEVKSRYDSQLDRVRVYFAEMNVAPEFLSFMQSIEPSDVRILTRAELNRYGLGSQDVAYNEYLVAERAAELGISSIEYRRREQRGRSECKSAIGVVGEPTELERTKAARSGTSVEINRQVECMQAIRYGISIDIYRRRESQVNEQCRRYAGQKQKNLCTIHFMVTGRAIL